MEPDCSPDAERVAAATRALTTLAGGDPSSAEQLFPLVYDELRELAGSYFRRQPADHTLQPTALVNEAYLRLIRGVAGGWNDREHFLAVAATAMRQILVNHAERRAALKRGGDRRRLTLAVAGDRAGDGTPEPLDLLGLDEALRGLSELDARKVRVVELRYFAGLTHEQIARVLGISLSTVEGDWRMARAWLAGRLRDGDGA
ncbi:MAG: sigma-70 family RNA polymerase sigma factor [Phycisphaerales bacterium]|nr:sigma-70 family RNA polymerase sigma factor [Phycisphaerales bacterium]NNM27300.1 sigma-70 family RNA polymerase sigma factor [Phycisphaerales bacterium]